jgi:hypothetical protein
MVPIANLSGNPSRDPIMHPRPSERTAAALMHVGSIFAPVLAPVAVYAISRNRSNFVAAHAWGAIREWLFLKLTLLAVGTVSLIYTITRLVQYYQADWQGFSIWEFLLRFAVGYILLNIVGLIVTALSILQAVRAWKGHWPRYLARKNA